MKKQTNFHKPQNRTRRWIGVTLLLGLLALAGCSQSQPTTSASADTTAAPVVVDTQPAATQPAAEPMATEAQPAAESTPTEAQPAVDANAAAVKLNLNTATSEEFQTVPDVGNRMVREFNEYRPYSSILQFRKEIGKYVDDAQVAAYEAYLFVPIDPNTSDTATLQQIPGVDEALAAALIDVRPYASTAAFVDKLAESLTPEQVAVAESYLVGE